MTIYRVTEKNANGFVQTGNKLFAERIAREHARKHSCEVIVKELRGTRWYKIMVFEGGHKNDN